MLDPKLIAQCDQASAALSETLPPLLAQFYASLLLQGFQPDQALLLTSTFLMGLMSSSTSARQEGT